MKNFIICGLKFIIYKDENKLNNCVDNLEWVSHKDNLRYGTACERRANTLRNKSQEERIALKFAKGWIPQLFRRKKRYAVIYNGVRYNSRDEWSEQVGLSKARLTQLVDSGKAKIEIYYTVEINK